MKVNKWIKISAIVLAFANIILSAFAENWCAFLGWFCAFINMIALYLYEVD